LEETFCGKLGGVILDFKRVARLLISEIFQLNNQSVSAVRFTAEARCMG
jgi:hypothetical protein